MAVDDGCEVDDDAGGALAVNDATEPAGEDVLGGAWGLVVHIVYYAII